MKNYIDKLNNVITKANIDKILCICTILIFVVFSLYKTLNHVPFFDEINAWNIAQNFKPWEIFEITKHEGHLFIWYFLLMPFAQNDIGFPIAMQLINWSFVFGAVLLLWFKAPFNSLTKVFITFSLPITILYIHARCYGIGVFLLFWVCTLYKNRLKHPFLYVFLLILIGNTSVMALFLAFALGLCFLYDLNNGIKNNILSKNDLFIIFGIIIVGSILILLQFYGYTIPYYAKTTLIPNGTFYDFFIVDGNNPLKLIFAICHLGLIAFAWDFFEKSKSPFIFLIISNILILMTFYNVYRASYWHVGFLMMTIVISIWMYLSEYEITQNFQKTYLKLCSILFIILTFCNINFEFYFGSHTQLAKDIQSNNLMKNKKIFFFTTDSSVLGITHEVKNMGIKYYDCLANPITSKDFYIHQWDEPQINFEKISKILKTNEVAYVFVDNTTMNTNCTQIFKYSVIMYNKGHSDLDIKLVDNNKYDLYIWQITKIK